MDGYDRGFRPAAGRGGRGIDRYSYDYQFGANPEAFRPPQGGMGGPARGGFQGRGFAGDEVGSYGGESGPFGPPPAPRGPYSGGMSGARGGSYAGGGYGRGLGGGGTFIGREGGASAGYGRDADDFAGRDFNYPRARGGYDRGFGGGTFIGMEGGASAGYGRDVDGFAGQEFRFRARQGFGDFQRGAFGGDYEAGNFGGFRATGRGFGGYGADYGGDVGRYDADYGGAFMGGTAPGGYEGSFGGYDGGYGDFGARSGGMLGGGFGGARGYDAGYGGNARGPFMPEEAYRRHPEYNQPRQPRGMGSERYGYAAPDAELSDDEVLHSVRTRLLQDRWLDADRINVEVEDGVVTLTGEVGDFMEARYAWDDAWETPGVHGVLNSLTVRTDLPHE